MREVGFEPKNELNSKAKSFCQSFYFPELVDKFVTFFGQLIKIVSFLRNFFYQTNVNKYIQIFLQGSVRKISSVKYPSGFWLSALVLNQSQDIHEDCELWSFHFLDTRTSIANREIKPTIKNELATTYMNGVNVVKKIKTWNTARRWKQKWLNTNPDFFFLENFANSWK